MICDSTEALLETLADLLGGHEDYSLSGSLSKLREVTSVNVCFEETLKSNVSCPYCRSFVYETVRFLCLPELSSILSVIRQQIADGVPDAEQVNSVIARQKELNDLFFKTPLNNLKPDNLPSLGDILTRASREILTLL